MQPERKPLPRRAPLGRARLELVRPDDKGDEAQSHAAPGVRPDLSFSVEPFANIAGELVPLFMQHHQEIISREIDAPLDPDWNSYFVADISGRLRVTTARCGHVVGYIFNLFFSHPMSKHYVQCSIERFYLDPVYRGGWFAVRWFRWNDHYLKDLGIKRIGVSTKNNYMDGRTSMIFRRLGYLPTETVWTKVL